MRDIYKEIDSGLPSSVYYIYGKDPFFLSEAVKKIRELIPSAERDVNFLSFDFDRTVESPPSINEIFDILNTPGFFGTARFLILKNLHLAKKVEMDNLIKNLGYYTRDNKDFPNKLFILSNKPPVQSLKKILKDECIYTTDKKPVQLRNWVKRLAKERGIIINDRAIEMLINLSSSEGGIIYSEIEKLSLIGKKEIGTEEINNVMFGAMEGNVFTLTEAIISGKKQKAFALLTQLDADTHSILGAINWKLKDVENKSKKNYYRAFKELFQSDLKIKTSSGSYPLEALIFKLLQI